MPKEPDLTVCTLCQKLFAPASGDGRCPQCAGAQEQKTFLVESAIYHGLKTTVQDIVDYTHLPEDEVVKILKNLRYLNESVVDEIPCARCKSKAAQTGSEFCLDCRIELHKAIEKATDAITARIGERPYVPQAMSPLSNVRAELEKKRGRTSTDSLRPRQPRFK